MISLNTCKTCAHAAEGALQADLTKPLICKRYPPTAALAPGPQGIAIVTISPTVQPEDSCGEYRGRDQTSETKIVTGR